MESVFLDAVQWYGTRMYSNRLLSVGQDDWDMEAKHVECLLQDWQRSELDYLRVCDGGVKDEHLLNYNYVLSLVCNYECDVEVGG